jgi:hypothetical protein
LTPEPWPRDECDRQGGVWQRWTRGSSASIDVACVEPHERDQQPRIRQVHTPRGPGELLAQCNLPRVRRARAWRQSLPGWMCSCTPASTRPSARASRKPQASGVAAVGLVASGPLDLIRPGETGLLFEPGQTGSLRSAVSSCWTIRCPCLHRRKGFTRGRTRTWPAVVDELVDRHYAEVLREAAAVRPAVARRGRVRRVA